MSEEPRCKKCGKLKLDHKRGFYGRRFCDDEETLFEPAEPSPAPQAERVIEVASQGEIPTAESAYEELIKNWRELYRDTVLQLRASDSSFTAALAELNDRDNHIKYAYDALGDVNRSIYLFDHIRKLREELDEAVRLRDKFQGALECANNAAKRRGEERDQLKSHYSDAKELIQRMMKEEEVLRAERDRAREALREQKKQFWAALTDAAHAEFNAPIEDGDDVEYSIHDIHCCAANALLAVANPMAQELPKDFVEEYVSKHFSKREGSGNVAEAVE